jgi:hypothetical protein
MDLSPGKLRLIAEDPRTEEEIEQDRLREAERLTMALFTEPQISPDSQTLPDQSLSAEASLYSSQTASESDEMEDEDEEDPEALPPLEAPLSHYAAYLQLVAAAEEQAATVSASSSLQIAQRIRLSAAQVEAKRAGLNETEISTAIAIGAFRGGASPKALLPGRREKVDDSEPVPAEVGTNATEAEIPILWLDRSDLVKGRPDRAEKLQALGADELEALAALVGEALEAFYWIQLKVILSLYLDHDLQLNLQVPQRLRQKVQQ